MEPILLLTITLLVLPSCYLLLKKYKKTLDNKKKEEILFDQTLIDKLRRILINNDLGANNAEEVINELKNNYLNSYKASYLPNKTNLATLKSDIVKLLVDQLKKKQSIASLNRVGVKTLEVFVLLGNNGVGKTNFAVKLAHYLIKERPRKVLVTSLDFFRAGAWQQLKLLVDNNPMNGVEYFNPKARNVKGHTYDTYEYGTNNYYDAIILDTSGRIHTNNNLMDEITAIQQILQSKNANVTNILILDNNFGTMALSSFEAFSNVIPINGIVLTKTDSGFGGGWVFKLIEQHKEVKFFGQVSGEQINSFSEFNQEKFCQNIINWSQTD